MVPLFRFNWDMVITKQAIKKVHSTHIILVTYHSWGYIDELLFPLLTIPPFTWLKGITASKVVRIVTALLSNHLISQTSILPLTQIFISADPLPLWHNSLSLDSWQFLNLLAPTAPTLPMSWLIKVVANDTPVYQLSMNNLNHWCNGICWSNCITIFPGVARTNINCTSM